MFNERNPMIDPHSDDVTPDWPIGQEAEEERVDTMLDKAYDMLAEPGKYSVDEMSAILDEIYWVQQHGDFDWSYDLQERLTVTANVMEEAL